MTPASLQGGGAGLRGRLAGAALALTLASVSAAVIAQPLAGVGRVPTVTRLVKLVAEHEQALQAAVAARDATALGRLLDDGFEMRVGAAPGQPVPRAEWLEAQRGGARVEYRFEQIAVHEVPGAAIASFTMVPAAGARATPLFVVDTWVGSGDEWRLKVRYVASTAPTQAPGQPKAVGTIPKKI